ncbi:uncharacterized protein IUM83_19958 [Phytophthora cinnamomi]|uniref:uncharacterized protein n=1 Tax=Phytophthora cinnamomi TaxID=4785 RepID=UPI0035596F90|nr:hypothetical protein IUM83_19958 [Phytophthora cinnamomi]
MPGFRLAKTMSEKKGVVTWIEEHQEYNITRFNAAAEREEPSSNHGYGVGPGVNFGVPGLASVGVDLGNGGANVLDIGVNVSVDVPGVLSTAPTLPHPLCATTVPPVYNNAPATVVNSAPATTTTATIEVNATNTNNANANAGNNSPCSSKTVTVTNGDGTSNTASMSSGNGATIGGASASATASASARDTADAGATSSQKRYRQLRLVE